MLLLKGDFSDLERDYFMYLAVLNDQAEVVSLLIKMGADLNKVFCEEMLQLFSDAEQYVMFRACGSGSTPLAFACYKGHCEVVKVLLREETDPNKHCSNDDAETPLTLAAEEGNLEIVQMLLRAGAKIDKTDNGEQTPLFIAAQHGHLEITNALLTAGAAVDKPNEWGDTPLIEACRNDHAEVVVALLKAGAYILRRNCSEDSAIDIASKQSALGNASSTKVLDILSKEMKAIESRYKNVRDKKTNSESIEISD
jgi:ankyrin repeat protein